MEPNESHSDHKIYFKKYLYQGIVCFCVVAAAILFFFFLFRFDIIAAFAKKMSSILQPITLGFLIAYIINPIVNFLDKLLLTFFYPRVKKPKKIKSIVRYISILIALILSGLFLYILGNMIIPELYVTIAGIVKELPNNVTRFTEWIEEMTASYEAVGEYINFAIVKGTEFFENWIQGDLLKQANVVASYFATGVINLINVIKNLLIGIIVSVYVLVNKEKFGAQCKMIIYAITKGPASNVIIDTVRQSHQIFSGFIVGKIIDSAIIGVLCFIFLSFMNMPYTLLVSVIVGVTNVIPFFGPFIGAVPCALLIIVVSPIHGLYFIIFIIILQQVDGNIIGPKILGDSTGLSAFWVIFSILVASGLFGIVGMLIGVPAFAVIYYIVRSTINFLLERKNFKSNSEEYEQIKSIYTTDGQVVYEMLEPLVALPDSSINLDFDLKDNSELKSKSEPENNLEFKDNSNSDDLKDD